MDVRSGKKMKNQRSNLLSLHCDPVRVVQLPARPLEPLRVSYELLLLLVERDGLVQREQLVSGIQ